MTKLRTSPPKCSPNSLSLSLSLTSVTVFSPPLSRWTVLRSTAADSWEQLIAPLYVQWSAITEPDWRRSFYVMTVQSWWHSNDSGSGSCGADQSQVRHPDGHILGCIGCLQMDVVLGRCPLFFSPPQAQLILLHSDDAYPTENVTPVTRSASFSGQQSSAFRIMNIKNSGFTAVLPFLGKGLLKVFCPQIGLSILWSNIHDTCAKFGSISRPEGVRSIGSVTKPWPLTTPPSARVPALLSEANLCPCVSSSFHRQLLNSPPRCTSADSHTCESSYLLSAITHELFAQIAPFVFE